MPGATAGDSSMQIGDTVRFRADAKHRDTLGPMADQVGIVVDVSEIDGVETLNVLYGDNGPLEAGVPGSEFEIDPSDAPAHP